MYKITMPHAPCTVRLGRLVTGYALKSPLNVKLENIAMRVMSYALEEGDDYLVAIMEYAVFGSSSYTLSMGDLCDRVIELKRHARLKGDKKMKIILDAAIANGS